MKFCTHCGSQLGENESFCKNCGAPASGGNTNMNQAQPNQGYQQYQQQGQAYQAAPGGVQPKSKMAAGLLGIFLGAWGVHNFYLGYTGKAVAQLVLTLFTCGIAGIWGFIEGILILTGSIKTDGKGNLLGE